MKCSVSNRFVFIAKANRKSLTCWEESLKTFHTKMGRKISFCGIYNRSAVLLQNLTTVRNFIMGQNFIDS